MTLEDSLAFIVGELRGRVRRDSIRSIAYSTNLPESALEKFIQDGEAPTRVLFQVARYFDNKAKKFARMTSP